MKKVKEIRMRRPNFTRETIKKVLQDLAACEYGEQVDILEENHIFPSQICRWRQKFGKTGAKIRV
jgi:hypothetical protein